MSYHDNHTANLSLSLSAGPRDHLHPHWHQFEEAQYGHHVAVGAVMVVILLLATITNVTTITVILRYPSLQTAGNMLVLNLALSDLLMALSGFPLYIVASFHGTWPFSSKVCELYGFAGGAFGLMSINTLAAIAIDRYLVIVRPRGGSKSKMRQNLWMILCVWILSIGWAIPPLFGWNKYTWEGYGTTCSYDYLTKTTQSKSFIWTMFVGGFLMPLFVIIYCYISIYRTVLQHKRQFSEFTTVTHAKVMRGSREYKHNVHVKTAIAACWCVVLFCLSWTPYAVLSLLGLLTDGQQIVPKASVLVGLLAKSSTIYNPLVYAIVHPRFKMKLKMCLTKRYQYTHHKRFSSCWTFNMNSFKDSKGSFKEKTHILTRPYIRVNDIKAYSDQCIELKEIHEITYPEYNVAKYTFSNMDPLKRISQNGGNQPSKQDISLKETILNTTCISDEPRYIPNKMFNNCAKLEVHGTGQIGLIVTSCRALPSSYVQRLSPSFHHNIGNSHSCSF